jgi:DNA polymerase III delta prime subunit
LLSGPPGIGKTTSAQLVCRELGLLSIEMNASDTRNKKSLDATVAELIGNTQLEEFFGVKGLSFYLTDISFFYRLDHHVLVKNFPTANR